MISAISSVLICHARLVESHLQFISVVCGRARCRLVAKPIVMWKALLVVKVIGMGGLMDWSGYTYGAGVRVQCRIHCQYLSQWEVGM